MTKELNRTNKAIDAKDARIKELEEALSAAAADLSQAGMRFHYYLIIAAGK